MTSLTASSPVTPATYSTHTHSASRKEACHYPSAEEWEAVRLTIRQFYIDENKTLSEVSELLEMHHDFRASPKQYKNHFKQWGLWKNLSTIDAVRLIQMKASRDSIGKTSTFVRAGQKLDFDRVQKTIRRSKNRVPKSSAEEKWPKLGRAEPARTAGNQPSRIECRTPSPEPLAAQDELDLLDSLESNSLRVDAIALDHDFSSFGTETFHTHLTDSLSPFSLSDAGQFEPFDACHYEDSHAEMVWKCYARVHHKLALSHEWLQANAPSDPVLRRFGRDNSLLAILEPVVAADRHHIMRELFLANFVSTFLHRPGLNHFAESIHGPWVRLFQTSRICRGIPRTEEDRDRIDSPSSSDDNVPIPKANHCTGLSPDVDLSCQGIETPSTPPNCNDYDNDPDTGELEAAAFYYHLGEVDIAETNLQALAREERSVSTKAQVFKQLAWYCLSCVERESGRIEEADGSLMKAIRGSTFYPATDDTEWAEVNYLFM